MIERYKTRNAIIDAPILFREAIRPGLISGVIGAVLMGILSMLLAARQGDPFLPMKLIAATFLKENALRGGFKPGPVLLGTLLHFTAAILLGIFFAWLGGSLRAPAATAWGVIFGLAVWVIMQYGILPVINPSLAAMPPGAFAVTHAVFGASLGTYPYFLPAARKVSRVERKAA